MRRIAEYLERALDFEKMAQEAADPKLKANLLQQAAAYRKLAEQRAKKLNLPPPPKPSPSTRSSSDNSEVAH